MIQELNGQSQRKTKKSFNIKHNDNCARIINCITDNPGFECGRVDSGLGVGVGGWRVEVLSVGEQFHRNS